MKLKKFNELNEEVGRSTRKYEDEPSYFSRYKDEIPETEDKNGDEISLFSRYKEDEPVKTGDDEGYFLITWSESGDETHFMLVSMEHFDFVNDMNGKLSDSKLKIAEIDKILGQIYKLEKESFFTQTYCTEDWPFENYTIKKIISIPELGA